MEDFLASACKNLPDFANPFAIAMAIKDDEGSSKEFAQRVRSEDSVSTRQTSNLATASSIDTLDSKAQMQTLQQFQTSSLLSPGTRKSQTAYSFTAEDLKKRAAIKMCINEEKEDVEKHKQEEVANAKKADDRDQEVLNQEVEDFVQDLENLQDTTILAPTELAIERTMSGSIEVHQTKEAEENKRSKLIPTISWSRVCASDAESKGREDQVEDKEDEDMELAATKASNDTTAAAASKRDAADHITQSQATVDQWGFPICFDKAVRQADWGTEKRIRPANSDSDSSAFRHLLPCPSSDSDTDEAVTPSPVLRGLLKNTVQRSDLQSNSFDTEDQQKQVQVTPPPAAVANQDLEAQQTAEFLSQELSAAETEQNQAGVLQDFMVLQQQEYNKIAGSKKLLATDPPATGDVSKEAVPNQEDSDDATSQTSRSPTTPPLPPVFIETSLEIQEQVEELQTPGEEVEQTLQDPEAVIDPLEKEKDTFKPRSVYKTGFLCIAFIALILVFLLGFFLGQDRKGDSSAASVVPTMAPFTAAAPTTTVPATSTPNPAPIQSMDEFRETLPEYTLDSLQYSFSPQSQAIQWLFVQEGATGMEEWRQTQLFVLATVYYSLGGNAWPFGKSPDWLDLSNGRTECDWYSKTYDTVVDSNHDTLQPCNAQGEFQSLRLESMDLSSQGTFLPPEVELLATLREIEISDSGIQAKLEDWIPTQLYQMAQLEELNVKANNFTGTIPRAMPPALNRLMLEHNILSGAIPSEIGLLTNLRILELHSNPLISGGIPSEIGEVTKLDGLDLSSMGLKGDIPSEVGLITNLKTLDLNSNDISGTVPTHLGRLTSLKMLRLQDNSFSGAIPSELALMTDLQGLYLDNNNIFGMIPTEIGSLSALTGLHLGHNELLSSPIPSEIGLASRLEKLYLMDNAFSGQMPTELAMLNSLEELKAEDNLLIGRVPSEIALMSSLIHLALNINSLTGSIPTELIQLTTTMTHFSVSDNPQLTGTVPSGLCVYENSFDCSYLLCGCNCICTR